MEGIQAITFDVGGTLIEPWPSVGQVYASVAEEQGIQGISPESLNKRFAEAWQELDGRAESRQDWAAIVEVTFRGIVSVAASQALFESLYARFTEPSVWHVFDDVRPTLEALQSLGVRLAILSNWDERLRPLLERLELMEFFEVLVVSSEVDVRKPEPSIFVHAAAALGLSSKQILHVGDSLEHDVLGARNAGMRSLGIERRSANPEEGWIQSLTDLIDLV